MLLDPSPFLLPDQSREKPRVITYLWGGGLALIALSHIVPPIVYFSVKNQFSFSGYRIDLNLNFGHHATILMVVGLLAVACPTVTLWFIRKQNQPIGDNHEGLLIYSAGLSFVWCVVSATFSAVYFVDFQTKTTTFKTVFKFYGPDPPVPSDSEISSVHTGLLILLIAKWICVLLPLCVPGMGWGFCFLLGSVVFFFLFFWLCILSSFGFYLLLSSAWGNSLGLFDLDNNMWICSICGIAVFLGFCILFGLVALNLKVASGVVSVPTVVSIVFLLIGLGRQRTLTCWADAKAHQHRSTIQGLCAEALPVAGKECRTEALFRRCREVDEFLLAFRIISGLFSVPSLVGIVAVFVHWIVKWRSRSGAGAKAP
jgi:hypothetical protein